MSKYLIYGSMKDKTSFFVAMQKASVAQFCNKEVINTPSALTTLLLQALKIIKPKKSSKQHDNLIDPESFAQNVIDKVALLKNLEKELKTLDQKIYYSKIFGEFSPNELDEVEEHYKIFFCRRRHSDDDLPWNALLLATEDDYDYIVSIKETSQSLENLEIGHLNTLLNDKDRLMNKIYDVEQFLLQASSYVIALEDALLKSMDDTNLRQAQDQSFSFFQDKIFITTAWIPMSNLSLVSKVVQQFNVEIEEVAITDKDIIPTYLKNSDMAASGEELVKLYDAPNIRDKDPSAYVVWSFILFGAIICSDAGYGLIYLFISLFVGRKIIDKTQTVKRILGLVKSLAIASIVWGILIGSYFGISLSNDNILRKYSLMSTVVAAKINFHKKNNSSTYEGWAKENPVLLKSENVADIIKNSDTNFIETIERGILLELSILIGILHLALSMMRVVRRRTSGIGWIIAMVGSYLYLPSILEVNSLAEIFFLPHNIAVTLGGYCIIAGFVTAWLSAMIQEETILGKIMEPWNVMQLFSDVLSYLRLYALALGSVIVTQTFNQQFIPAFGPFWGTIGIILGHLLNLILVVVAVIVHGLRLNFLEWYRYSFEGEGLIFKPLTNFFHRRGT